MTTTGQSIEQLRQKYEPALRDIEKQNVHLIQVSVQNDKLYIHGAAPSKEALDRIQQRVAEIDPNWSREVDLDLRSPGVQASHTGQNVVQHAEDFEQASDDTGESR